MSELEYDSRYSTWLTGASLPVPSNPINLKGVVKQMLASWPAGGGGSGTVTSVSVVSANGLAGTVATATTTPALTLSTTITGVLKGNATAISAATAGTDYSAGTSALATGLVKSTTTTGALSIAAAGTDYPATGVITAGGPTGSGVAVPVITYNANGQLTVVTTSATVGTVAATDTSIVVGGTATAPTIATGTLDVIATQHAPAADWSNNSHKITSLANGSGAQDAAAFGQIPTKVVSAFTLLTITADPNPGVVGTYYRTNYAGNGNFTLPVTPVTGSWIWLKQVANNTLSIVGTVDGNASFTMVQYQSYLLIYNGSTWDIN